MFSFLLILFVISLHGFLRFAEMPYSKKVLANYYWEASINLAAGKGFSDLGGKSFPEPSKTDPSPLYASPELAKFINKPFNKSGEKLSFSHTFFEFTDYPTGPKTLGFTESIGYRYCVGLIWKVFGFNWIYVAVFNYLFSLAAMLSLMYCSYRTLGVAYSIAIGFIYSISILEINFVVSFGRDGFPLWFASYLICTLLMFLNKPLTLKRIVSYTILMGAIIFAAVQARGSSIYFLPLLACIYFYIFFFRDENIKFNYSHIFSNSMFEKTFLFVFATALTFLSEFILSAITNAYLLKGITLADSCTMHVIFIGLGVWGNNLICPSPLSYSDGHGHYLATEYGRRVLGFNSTPFLSSAYQESLKGLYLSILKTYPYFYFSKVFFGSFYETIVYLCRPLSECYVSTQSEMMKFIYKVTHIFWKKPFLFFGAFFGCLILYFRLHQRKIVVILAIFIFFNAGVSFLQFDARHALMGHPAYYFLAAVTLTFLCEHIVSWARSNTKPKRRLIEIKKQFRSFSYPIILTSLFGMTGLIYFANAYLKHLEQKNIQFAQKYFESLERYPLEFNLNQNTINFPSSLLHKTVGVYCELGRVTSSSPINIEIMSKEPLVPIVDYKKKILPIEGENIILFIPFYFMNEAATLKILKPSLCKSLAWSDLKEWKGPLWEGTYDKDILQR